MTRVIDQMFREVAEATPGINFFEHAPKPYANAEPGKFPRIWVYDTRPTDTVGVNGSITTEYSVLFEISDLVQLDDKPASLEDVLARVDGLFRTFINKLTKDTRLTKPIGKVERIEILHHLDHNVAGFLCTAFISVNEPFTIDC